MKEVASNNPEEMAAHSFIKGMPAGRIGKLKIGRLTALTTGTIGLFGFRRLNNIRGWCFGRIGRIPRKYSDLLSKLSIFLNQGFVGFKKFNKLLFKSGDPFINLLQLSFKFCNAPLIELFSFRDQFLPSNHLLWLLSGERVFPFLKIGGKIKNRHYSIEL